MTTWTDGRADQQARALLIEMLGSIRHSPATPVHFWIDAPRIAAAALRKVGAAREDEPRLCAAIDRIAREALECPSEATEGGDDARRPDATLAAWLDRRHRQVSAIHPLAMDVLGLLVECELHREVAERLDLGLRLTHRIARDARAAWMEDSTPCSSR